MQRSGTAVRAAAARTNTNACAICRGLIPLLVVVLAVACLWACSAPDGSAGTAGIAGTESASGASDYHVGTPPDLVALSDGAAHAFSDMVSDDTPTVVVFMTVWCGPCRAEQPEVEAFATKHAGEVRVVYICSGSDLQRVTDMAKERDLKVDVLVDGDGAFADHFGVRATPTLILFTPEGGARGPYRHLEELPFEAPSNR